MSTMLSSLEPVAVGRKDSLFAPDLAARDAELREAIGGQAVLILGGAGSIGAATTKLLVHYAPSRLHLVDQDENGLVELLRDMRSSGLAGGVADLRILAMDYGSPNMKRFLGSVPPYQLILNFAAIKHVRSEKDVPSTLHLLDTNVVKPHRLLEWLAAGGFTGRYYAVSTDKAADPVNFMGASKRVQEMLTLGGPLQHGGAHLTCARFANVAFSNGSLLHGFLQRLERGQPLAVPKHVSRYLITHEEAAQICALATVCGPSSHTVVPRTGGTLEPVELSSVAQAILKARGLKPLYCATEDEARARASQRPEGSYPVLLTEPDTAGEKPTEQFVGAGEAAVEIGLKSLLGIRQASEGSHRAVAFARAIERLIADPDRPVTTAELRSLLVSVLPTFQHTETGKSLDHRM